MGISQRATMSIWSARLCLCVVALLCLTITPVDADLPVHCTHAEVQGEWVFHRGQGGLEKAGAKCSKGAKRFDDRTDAYGLGEPNYKVVDQMKVKLLEPNVAVHTNAQGKQVKGTWTMIYDEGFEVIARTRHSVTFNAVHATKLSLDGITMSRIQTRPPGDATTHTRQALVTRIKSTELWTLLSFCRRAISLSTTW